MDESYTERALTALGEAVTAEHDFPGWLAGVLARIAAAHGGSYALIAGRPGSWEAGHVERLVCGTVGWDDQDLAQYATGPADQPTSYP